MEILLPVIVYGNKAVDKKIWVEDSAIVRNLEIGSRAFFFARDNTGKKIYKDAWGFDLEDICFTQWGEDSLLLKDEGLFILHV